MALKITLKPNEKMIIGGAVIRAGDNKCQFVVENNIPILRQNRIMTADDAHSPARRIYLAIQLMYVDDARIAEHQKLYWELIRDFVEAAPSSLEIVDQINELILSGDFYQALKTVRHLIDFEQEVIERATKCSQCVPIS
jgi:flagellar protein FlbT